MGTNGKDVRPINSWQFVAPIYLRWKAAFLYHTTILRVFRWRIRNWVLRRWHPRDKPPRSIHSRCIWSYRYRTAWFDVHRLLVLRLRWIWLVPDTRPRTICKRCSALPRSDTDARRVRHESADSDSRARTGN